MKVELHEVRQLEDDKEKEKVLRYEFCFCRSAHTTIGE